MNPDLNNPDASFALLATGANFSCEVLRALQQKNYPPELIVLPEYPPATGHVQNENLLGSASRSRPLLMLAQDIEITYAPELQQAECATLIRQRQIDFLLVACWPYLIEARLLESAGKATLNLHPSLLPQFRGPNPLKQQLATGDSCFGTTLHLLDQRFDHGDIISQAQLSGSLPPHRQPALEQLCARRGVELFIDAVDRYPDWNPKAQTT